jgi:tetratricopeptide (TPR) repeat protein/tRNA A-37 threonylcarbamoyl transferase component Bud32
VERFVTAWRQGQRPDLQAYLSPSAVRNQVLLVQLVAADLQYRLQAGEPARVEMYLDAYPELAGDQAVLLDLITLEFEVRRHREPDLTLEEYTRRFPTFRADLPSRLETRRAKSPTWDEISCSEGAPATLVDPRYEATPGVSPAPASVPGNQRYNPLRFHAQGGLGEVLVAHDEELRRDVALKRIQPPYADNAENRRRFLIEAEITGRLEHPGIVPVYGLVHDEAGRPSYAMRFIEGVSLKEAIDRFHAPGQASRGLGERRLELRQLLGRFIAVCNTMAYAHSRGVLHRDLKPANIMLGRFGETLVVDWGLAKAFHRDPGARAAGETALTPSRLHADDATQMGAAVGTPAYMSPEQAAGQWNIVGPASDIYSLGATLYTLLTGQPPPSRVASLPRHHKKDVPRALEAICFKAMARRPAERYGTALELASDLEQWLADEPVSAYRQPWHQRVGRWMRRHRTAVTAGGVALILTIVAVLTVVFLGRSAAWRQQQQARRSAEANEELGLAELHAGRYGSAEKLFGQAVYRLRHEQALDELRARVKARRDRAGCLIQFYVHSDQAELLEIRDQDQQALAECEAGLKALAVFDHADWWSHLPTADLTAEQREQLQSDVFRHLLLLGVIRTKIGMLNFQSPKTMSACCRSALRAVTQADRFAPSRTGSITALLCHFLLGEYAEMKALPKQEPKSAVDYYYIGILHWWLAKRADLAMTRLAVGGIGHFVPGIDFQTPEETAERYVRRATRLQPRHFWSYLWLAMILRSADKLDAAEVAFSACVSLRPDYPVGYLLRAQLLEQQGWKTSDPKRRDQLFGHALEDVRKALELNPKEHVAYNGRASFFARRDDWDKALADYNKAIELDPKSAAYRTNRAAVYLKKGDCDNALADVTEALGLNPRWAPACNVQGNVYYRQRALDQAIAAYTKAIQYNPAGAVYYANRGRCYFDRKAYDQAIADLDQAIRRNQRALQPLLMRGLAYLWKGNLNRALEDFDTVLRFNPRHALAYNNRGFAYAQAGRWREAQQDFERAIALDASLVRSWSHRIHLKLRAGDGSGYRLGCAALLKRFSETQDAWTANEVAWACVLAPDAIAELAPVVRLAQTAQAAHPKETDYLRTLGAALYRAGQTEQAIQRLNEALTARGRDSTALDWLFLSMAHHKQGHAEQASHCLAKAIEQIEEESRTRPPDKRGLPAVLWERAIKYQILRQEAEKLGIQPPAR